MKIGIVTSNNDMLSLFKFLNKYDHEYVIYYDFLNGPYWDKTFNYSLEQINKWVEFLTKQWCEKIIIPPIYELAINKPEILPLFKSYLSEHCFKSSLIGNIWIFWDFADIQEAQNLINKESEKYSLTDNQKNIKKFNFPFNYWTKETSIWKYLITHLSYSDYTANKIIKHDLRYFKDTNTDTIIPLNYWYFNYQTTISKLFNFKKTRFHKIDKLEEIFTENTTNWKKYWVEIHYTGHTDFINREKRLLRLLQRWKSTEIKFKEIK